MAAGYSLQGFVGHAASPEAGPVEQHLPKVPHLGIHGPLITATTQSWLKTQHTTAFTCVCIDVKRLTSKAGGSENRMGGPRPALPEEGELPAVHPGTKGQAGVLPERWHDTREHQSQEDQTGRQHNLPERETMMSTALYNNCYEATMWTGRWVCYIVPLLSLGWIPPSQVC